MHDPVLLAQLVALVQGEAEPQAQNVSNAADPTVTSHPVAPGALTLLRSAVAANGPSGTDLRLETVGADDGQAGELALRVNRVLQPADGIDPNGDTESPCLAASWRAPDGSHVRGVFAAARYWRI